MVIGQLAETQINSRELVVDWQISDFFSLTNAQYISNYFNFRNDCLYFKLYIGRLGKVSIHLAKQSGPTVSITFSFGIRGLDGIELKKEKVHIFREQSCVGFTDFCNNTDLRNPRLVQDNEVIFSCEIKINDIPCVRDVCTQTSSPIETLNEVTESSDKRGGEKALNDFGKLLASGEMSDVTIEVKDVEFKAHSAILFARSPALSISLQHESKEKASNKIVIEDCEPDIFREFLMYLYTGSVQSLTSKNAFGLYRIGDKYLAEVLKGQCLKHVADTLCVQTFCNTVRLALTHGESALLQQAIRFASENVQSIICSVEWQEFICECPMQANEILIKCLGPRS